MLNWADTPGADKVYWADMLDWVEGLSWAGRPRSRRAPARASFRWDSTRSSSS
jgi:hypothetical protein